MNQVTRGIGLLMLGMTAACAADSAPASEQKAVPSAPSGVSTAAAPHRNGAPFSRAVRDQLAAHGIDVHDGSQSERTTVELEWNVHGHGLTVVSANAPPTTVPERYAVQLHARMPLVVRDGDDFEVDQRYQGAGFSHCSGTLVGIEAVMTAAHCVIGWEEVGTNAATKLPSIHLVRAYSIAARPRRNGLNNAPDGVIGVKKAFWDSDNWPGSTKDDLDRDADYAVVRLKKSPRISSTSTRVEPAPSGSPIEVAHYPFATRRDFRMFHSEGELAGLFSIYDNVYRHNASAEPMSSGAGVFGTGIAGAIGILVSADPPKQTRLGQLKTGFPNHALMLTEDTRDNISTWTNASLSP